MDLEQHFTTGDVLERLRSILATLDLRHRHVLEIGAGKGAVTELILERGANVTAFEIEPGLCQIRNDRLTVREEDATRADLSFGWDCLISVPPYELLSFIAKLCADRPFLSMIPVKRAVFDLFPGARELARFDGNSFEPPSTGMHAVIERGLR